MKLRICTLDVRDPFFLGIAATLYVAPETVPTNNKKSNEKEEEEKHFGAIFFLFRWVELRRQYY